MGQVSLLWSLPPILARGWPGLPLSGWPGGWEVQSASQQRPGARWQWSCPQVFPQATSFDCHRELGGRGNGARRSDAESQEWT